MTYADYTVEQLVEAATELNDRVDTLFTTLARISSTARADGIEATVDLEGRLVALRLDASALTQPPDALAAEIFRLTQEASAAALSDGLRALTPVAGEELTEELRTLIGTHPEPPRPSHTPDDFSEIRSWAVR